MKKKLVIAAAALTLGVGSLGAAGLASAATNSSTSSDTSIVDKLAAKFGLKKADVQAVFDADRAEHEAEHLTNLTEQLKILVTDDKITQAQGDAILAKYKELKAAREADKTDMGTLTDDERKAKMDEMRTAFDDWVSSSGIPQQYARLAMGGRGGHGFGHGPGGDMAAQTDGSSSSSSSSSTSN